METEPDEVNNYVCKQHVHALEYRSCEVTSHSFEGLVQYKPSCSYVSCVFTGCYCYGELGKSVMPVITPSMEAVRVRDANISLQR